jgi:hypothetical protein
MTALQRIIETPNVVPSDALIDRRSGKPKRVPKAVRHAIRLIESGEVTTIKAAAERTGLSREHLSKSLAMPHVQAFIAQRTRETIGAGLLRAGVRAVELLDAKSEHVSADMTKHVLATHGIAPASQGTNINITNNIAPGYVIDMRDPRETINAKPVVSD